MTAAQVNAKNTVIKSGAAYITANGTTYIVDKDTKFVDVDENQVYTGFENVPDYIADSTVDGGKGELLGHRYPVHRRRC